MPHVFKFTMNGHKSTEMVCALSHVISLEPHKILHTSSSKYFDRQCCVHVSQRLKYPLHCLTLDVINIRVNLHGRNLLSRCGRLLARLSRSRSRSLLVEFLRAPGWRELADGCLVMAGKRRALVVLSLACTHGSPQHRGREHTLTSYPSIFQTEHPHDDMIV